MTNQAGYVMFVDTLRDLLFFLAFPCWHRIQILMASNKNKMKRHRFVNSDRMVLAPTQQQTRISLKCLHC